MSLLVILGLSDMEGLFDVFGIKSAAVIAHLDI
jgi:hypothetical protein